MYPGTYARKFPDKVAAIRPATGETLTYRQLDDRSNRLAQLFYDAGLRKGGHVALFCENSLVYLDVAWACMRSGLYLTTVNRFLTAEEAAYIVDNCDATALLASAALEQSEQLGRLSPRCSVKLSIGGEIPGFREFEAALAHFPAEPLIEETVGAYMFYSSGTTGKPKGVLRPLPNIHPDDGNPGQQSRIDMFQLGEDTVYLSPAPLYHAAPLGYAGSVIQAGGTVIVMDKFDPEAALQLIERHKVTHSQWVPTMFVRLLKLPEDLRSRYRLSSHRLAIHAAAPCPVEVKRAMIAWWGPILVEYYSSTESAGMAMIDSKDWLAHPGSVGRARGKPFHICDDEGAELPAGEPGLIYGEAGDGASFEYYKDPGKTASVRHPRNPRWISVGDIGYLDEDGYLFLTDRKSFMIVSGGVNIYPQQIENALALHPKVEDVAVIGVPNPDLGEEVKAVVQVAAGISGSDALEQEILAFVREKLGRQLTPRSVDFVDALPRLPTGKLYKKVLRDAYWGIQPGGEGARPVSLSARL